MPKTGKPVDGLLPEAYYNYIKLEVEDVIKGT